MSSRILYICTNASAGMRHFSVCILNTMLANTEVDCYAIVMSEPDNDYWQDIVPEYRNRVIFMSSPRSRYQRVKNLLFPAALYRQINEASQRFQIDIIHCLTEDPYVASIIKRLKRKFEIYYTIHDLEQHEICYRNILHKLWFEWSHRMKVKKLTWMVDNLVTSSKTQCLELCRKFPTKNVYYHPFPSLLTEAIISGSDSIPEIKDARDYFLFFGRIEKYKGVDILYHIFKDSYYLRQEKLVIAGKGDIYFDYQPLPNVTLINRFIRDNEIRNLFQKAKCVIFPYISATQSGVFSFCFYFRKKIIASDVPFFREFQNETGLSFFNVTDPLSLEKEIRDFLEKEKNNQVEIDDHSYERLYGQEALKKSLLKLYNRR